VALCRRGSPSARERSKRSCETVSVTRRASAAASTFPVRRRAMPGRPIARQGPAPPRRPSTLDARCRKSSPEARVAPAKRRRRDWTDELRGAVTTVAELGERLELTRAESSGRACGRSRAPPSRSRPTTFRRGPARSDLPDPTPVRAAHRRGARGRG
jgi:hypothetical protein